MATERDSLEIHVDLCELRYKALEDRMTRIEARVQDLNTDVKDFKEEVQASFNEIKNLIGERMSNNQRHLITAAGSVIVALIGFLGYLLTHIR